MPSDLHPQLGQSTKLAHRVLDHHSLLTTLLKVIMRIALWQTKQAWNKSQAVLLRPVHFEKLLRSHREVVRGAAAAHDVAGVRGVVHTGLNQ